MINYFDFFDLPPAVDIDESLLRKRFLLNSKRFHPDFHTLESPEAQQHALEMASLNNEAWLVLSDFDRRIRHLLQLQDALPEEGQQKLPQDFLMEIMELMEIDRDGGDDRVDRDDFDFVGRFFALELFITHVHF